MFVTMGGGGRTGTMSFQLPKLKIEFFRFLSKLWNLEEVVKTITNYLLNCLPTDSGLVRIFRKWFQTTLELGKSIFIERVPGSIYPSHMQEHKKKLSFPDTSHFFFFFRNDYILTGPSPECVLSIKKKKSIFVIYVNDVVTVSQN